MTQADPNQSLIHLSDALADAVAATAPSLVSIHSHRARSSGFAWRPDLVVTADEALAEDGEIAVTLPGGDPRPASIVGRDPTTDVALLRVDGGRLPAVSLAVEPTRAGALVLAVGGGEGVPLQAFGAVALAGPGWRSLRGGEIDARIELDLRLRREAEGGLVINASGQALGMAVFGPRRRVLVIPSATIERVAAKLETHGRVARGYLGLGLQPVRVDGVEGAGVMIMSVDRDGPGAAAGVVQGDVIVAWDGRPLGSARALLRALGPDSVGKTVTLGLRRGGSPIELPITIGERPAA